jgi:hypothetical protein
MGTDYVEARVLVPEEHIDAFLTFCDDQLETMPAINRIPDAADGHEVIQEIEEAARRSEPEAQPTNES